MLLLLLFACKPRRRLAWTIGSCNICAAFKELSRTLPAKLVRHRKVCLLATSWQFQVKVAFIFHPTPYSQCVFLQLPESMQHILMRARFDSTTRIKLFDLFTEASTQGNSTSNQTPTRTHACTRTHNLHTHTHMATNHITTCSSLARIKLCYFHEQPKSMQIFVMHKHMIRRAKSTFAGTAATATASATTITITTTTTTASSGRAMCKGCKPPGCQAGKKGR